MRYKSASAFLALATFIPTAALAATGPASTSFSNPLFNAMLAVIVLLAIIILALAGAMRNFIGSDMFVNKLKESAARSGPGKKSLVAAGILLNATGFSQTTAQSNSIGGLDQSTFYIMLCVIGSELLVLGVLFNTFRTMLSQEQVRKRVVAATSEKRKTVFDKVNAAVKVEEEDTIMLDHDYDGIRELDNVLPPWWKYGFYLTILVAVVYMVAYHITDSLPLQKAEYESSIKQAEAEVAEYMKNSASNVDETTIKMLADPSDLATGKDLFMTSCAACHGRFGEGGVGPNLTDDYWMHNGGLPDIFKSIKYGWPDKGMKSWKEDFSPMQIAQITSYIKSLRGSNPPNAKEKQGDLYTEQAAPANSIAGGGDTLSTLTSQALPTK
jgi:cytochrome c oxidase cbb3-type subunit 3